MKTEKTKTEKSADFLVKVLEQWPEELQKDFWLVTNDTLKCFADQSFSAVHILVSKGEIRVVPINMEVEEAQNLIAWLGIGMQEERAADISAAASALKN